MGIGNIGLTAGRFPAAGACRGLHCTRAAGLTSPSSSEPPRPLPSLIFPQLGGVYLADNPPPNPDEWPKTMRFDSEEKFNAWIASEERRGYVWRHSTVGHPQATVEDLMSEYKWERNMVCDHTIDLAHVDKMNVKSTWKCHCPATLKAVTPITSTDNSIEVTWSNVHKGHNPLSVQSLVESTAPRHVADFITDCIHFRLPWSAARRMLHADISDDVMTDIENDRVGFLPRGFVATRDVYYRRQQIMKGKRPPATRREERLAAWARGIEAAGGRTSLRMWELLVKGAKVVEESDDGNDAATKSEPPPKSFWFAFATEHQLRMLKNAGEDLVFQTASYRNVGEKPTLTALVAKEPETTTRGVPLAYMLTTDVGNDPIERFSNWLLAVCPTLPVPHVLSMQKEYQLSGRAWRHFSERQMAVVRRYKSEKAVVGRRDSV